ncbi:hypothetical protein [Streptomyces carpinensis]|uniref:Uncharacterized protein n=1 Tax=Streptomyces carpinensis TaxID=66369 RepID=A0ABV1VW91_9ACTN|nr:hypothetical protein [Streptomyces carpinensis]
MLITLVACVAFLAVLTAVASVTFAAAVSVTRDLIGQKGRTSLSLAASCVFPALVYSFLWTGFNPGHNGGGEPSSAEGQPSVDEPQQPSAPHPLVATAAEGMDAMTASQALWSWIRAPRPSAHSSAHALSCSICREVSPYAV